MTDELEGDWLPVREAALRLGVSEQAIRSKLQRRTMRSRKGNRGDISVYIEPLTDEPPDDLSVVLDHTSNIDRQITDELSQLVPAWVYRAAQDRHEGELVAERQRHEAELVRQYARHLAELTRLERAYQSAADALMAKVSAVMVASRPRRSWWRW